MKTNYFPVLSQVNTTSASTNKYIEASDFLEHVYKEFRKTGGFDFFELVMAACIIAYAILSVLNQYRLLRIAGANNVAPLSQEDLRDIQEIDSILNSLIGTTDCDRICVGILYGIGDRRMRIAYEARKHNGIASLKEEYSDVDLGAIREELLLSKHNQFTKFSRSDEGLAPGCCRYLDNIGLHTIYSRLLLTKKKLYGIIEIQYTDKPELDFMQNANILKHAETGFNRLSKTIETSKKRRGFFL